MSTDTPRTDAWTTFNGVPGIEYVYATVARTLERELADLRSQLELASPKTQIISEPNSLTAFSLNP